MPCPGVNQRCATNVCTCPDGVGTKGKSCLSNGRHQCQSCNHGYYLSGHVCRPTNFSPLYIGCYKDDGSRDFKHGPKRYGYSANSCARSPECKDFKFAALQNGGWCSCDNTYSSPSTTYTKRPDGDCNKGGTGLGGTYKNAIYAIPRTSSPTYIGCYKDNGSRDFQYGPKSYGYDATKCAKACPNHKYVALQNGGWCSCDNTYSSPSATYTKRPDGECNKGGTGYGGSWRNAIYVVKGGFTAHEE